MPITGSLRFWSRFRRRSFHVYAFQTANGGAVWSAILSALALGVGTMLFPFGLVLNHHVPAALCLLASLYLVRISIKSDLRRPILLFGAGFFAALAPSFDLPASILGLALFGIAVARVRALAIYFVLGGLLPVAATMFLDYQISGTILPPQLVPNGFNYPGSAFPSTLAGIQAAPDIPRYAFEMHVGERGLYAYNPILLFGLFGLFYATLKRSHPLRVEALFVSAGFMLLTCYLVSSTNHFGGVAYGERLYLSAIPLVFSFVAFAPPFVPSGIGKVLWAAFACAPILSLLSVREGVLHPWGVIIPPPLELAWRSNLIPLGVELNFIYPPIEFP